MPIKFQYSMWVCIEMKNARKKGRKEGRDEVTVNGKGQFLFPCQKMLVGTVLNSAKGFFSPSAINTDVKA